MVVRQSELSTKPLIGSKVCWCSAVHSRKAQLHPSLSMGLILMCVRPVWARSCLCLTRPKNCCTYFAKVGAFQFSMRSILEVSTLIPFSKMWWPKKSIFIANDVNFFVEQCRWASQSACRTDVMFAWCSASELDQMMMSLRYTWQIFPISCARESVTHLWCVAGEFCKPISITTHSQSLKGVRVAVYLTWSGCTGVWKNEFVMLIFPHIFFLCNLPICHWYAAEDRCLEQSPCWVFGSHSPTVEAWWGLALGWWKTVRHMAKRMAWFALLLNVVQSVSSNHLSIFVDRSMPASQRSANLA